MDRTRSPLASFGAVLLLALAVALPLAAAEFPRTVPYLGQTLDAAGQPLGGTHELTVRYFDLAGAELYAETLPGVVVKRGNFQIELGTGRALAGRAFDSLQAVFAAHPEVEMELAVDGLVQEPRLGILPAGHSLKSRLVAAGVRQANDDQPHWKGYELAGGATAVQSGVLGPKGTRQIEAEVEGQVWRRPYTLPVVGPFLSQKVSDLPIAEEKPIQAEDAKAINAPRHETLFDKEGNRFGTVAPKEDDLLAGPSLSAVRTPPLSQSFEGVNNVSGVLPPDTEAAVGPSHIVQVVNLAFSIYNKSGVKLTGPSNTNTLWAGFGGPCQTDNSGDAIFVYDRQADRFVLTQFAVAGSHQSVCFAVSQTNNPTGAYFLYEVVTPRFPDYYKVGTWPVASDNAYFFGTNSGFQSQYDVFAVDRERMLAGLAARPMQFFQNFTNLMMPADVDGATPPPAGSPGLFYNFKDGGEPYFGSPANDSLDVYAFNVDWTTPANSSITLINSITPASGLAAFNWTVCGFFVSNCLPQSGTAQGIDSASWWPMQRLVYRNFGSHQTLLSSWTVDVNATGNRAAPRWFELRNTGGGWSIFQQGTHSPDTQHRFMPSVAMDGVGNIALGYSRTSSTTFPSIYYATHETTDALGTMQAEALLFAGTGSQTSTSARWGDYSSMDIDPADDCTFWFTTEYLAVTSSATWRTRIGSFALPSCTGGGGNTIPSVSISAPANGSSFTTGTSVTFTGTATDVEDGTLTAGLSWSSSINGVIGSGGSFSTSALSVGTHIITASVTDSGSATGSSSIAVTINAAAGVLTNGVPVTGIAGALNSQQFWTLAVPAGATNLSFTTSGGTGDMDLYVRFGSQPTTSVSDCASTGATTVESCSFPTPSTGTYHVLMFGFSAYSGVTLTGSYTAPGGSVTVTFNGIAAEDGRIWESGETGNVGGGGNSTDNNTSSLRVGDTNVDEQYKSIVSFDTSSIPDTATITVATLRLVRGTISGTSPFTTHGACVADISTGGFGGAAAFAIGDWQAAATATNVATMSTPASNGAASTGTLSAAGRAAVSKTGRTQLRVYCTLDDNDDLGFDYIGFYPAESTVTTRKPQLTVTYTP
jgi:hypothetical protein